MLSGCALRSTINLRKLSVFEANIKPVIPEIADGGANDKKLPYFRGNFVELQLMFY